MTRASVIAFRSSFRSFRSDKLPFSIRVLLESALRTGASREELDVILGWGKPFTSPRAALSHRLAENTWKEQPEVAFTPSRVLLQDFTGVPCIVDLAAMRDAVRRLGGDPEKVSLLLSQR
jgi:aconitate hydratase